MECVLCFICREPCLRVLTTGVKQNNEQKMSRLIILANENQLSSVKCFSSKMLQKPQQAMIYSKKISATKSFLLISAYGKRRKSFFSRLSFSFSLSSDSLSLSFLFLSLPLYFSVSLSCSLFLSFSSPISNAHTHILSLALFPLYT